MRQYRIPSSWKEVKFGDITDYGKTQKCELSDVPSDTWVLELEDIEKDSSRILKRLDSTERPFRSTKNRFSVGDVLYGKLRPYLNKVVIANNSGVCSTEIIPLNVEPHIDNRFLFYWLKSKTFLDFVNSVSYGVNMPRLGTKDGLRAPFNLAPRAEQKIIADKLDTLLAQVEATKARLERIPEILKTFRQSILAAAVSGKLTEEWRDGAAFKEHSVLFSSLIKESSVGLVRAAGEQYEDSNGRLPYVKMNNIDNFWGYNTDNLKYVDASKEERIKYGLGKDDWLFNTRNSTELVGKSCVWKGKEGLLYNNNILRVKFNDTVLADYVELFFKSPKGQQQLTAIKSGTTNVAAIYQKQLFKLSIYITDLEEQTEIVCRVEELFAFAARIEQKANTALQRVNKFTQSILAKAFRGELTSDWRAANPELSSGENSAEALLERIKVEREALKPVRKSSVRKKS
ncbi:restriction endonuclease subunit S [Alteromonas mediterranea]|uniref:restriction endonuclease subunit S n=1 Tax=Alteromonas mediterranea TaxID=314275 RepID=UPI001130C1EA|nr:restriction endonuclease subunit S [Alteromonas mediterranea]QDG35285.1 restriction endonuclease subunit S [Alteromonas mediterranea]